MLYVFIGILVTVSLVFGTIGIGSLLHKEMKKQEKKPIDQVLKELDEATMKMMKNNEVLTKEIFAREVANFKKAKG